MKKVANKKGKNKASDPTKPTWCFLKNGTAVNVSAPMTADEINAL